jgi:hypothetical protein
MAAAGELLTFGAEMRGESRRMDLFGSGGNACQDPSTGGGGVRF